MSSDWQKLADIWYRKLELCRCSWSDDPEKLYLSVVAGAPFGGPVATVRDEKMLQPVRGSLKPELEIWTSAGERISSRPWEYSGLLSMAWSYDQELVCVFESGVVRTFSVMCEKLSEFTIDDRVLHEGGALLASIWGEGVAVMTRKFSVFVNYSVRRSGDACHRFADLKLSKAPLSMCVLPPVGDERTQECQVVVGSSEGPMYLVERHRVQEVSLPDGPFINFAVSSSHRLLACLSDRGAFKVLSVTDNLQKLDEGNIQCGTRPRQMVWCTDDCIVLYYAISPPAESMRHIVFVGGPQDDWIPYHYDTPVHLVSEWDGCRIVGPKKTELVQRVPASTEAIFSIGNCDPPAMLCYALERYEKGDVCAQESLRLIKGDLAEAVETCTEAARVELEPQVVQSLLNASKFGRHFMATAPDTSRFLEVCRNLRICNDLREGPVQMCITVPQLERLGYSDLVKRLSQRRHHLLAARLCDWVGVPKDTVLFLWACDRIRLARNNAETDEQLGDCIMAKFEDTPGVSFAEVARVAAATDRPHLATKLLSYETRSRAQVKVLLQLSVAEGATGQLMLRLALEKAAQSHDPDLVQTAIRTTCGAEPTSREADVQALVQFIKEKPLERQVLADLYGQALTRANLHDRARTFHESLGRSKFMAFSNLHQAYYKRDADDRSKWLRFVRDDFERCEGSCAELEKPSMQFCAQSCSEEIDLLKAQISLEELALTKKWPNGPHRFAGLSLVKTLTKLIAAGEIVEADNLHTKLKLSGRRYWRIKVRALADAKNWTELNTMATHLTSPVGYELVVDAFLKHGQIELAKPFVAKVKGYEQQAEYYEKMGLHAEARAARAQRQERSGAGKLLQNFLRFP